MNKWDRLPRITEDEFVAHLDDDHFFEEYGNPVVIQSKEHGELVCMSYAYRERMHKEIEAAREAASEASMPADQERDIDYWIYEFQMPDEDKKRLLDMAASLGMTSDEFIQASFRYAMDYPDESEKEAKDIRKAGEVIKYRKNRESESKNVIDNEGRLQVKRIFAVLANRQLRKKYFGF